MFISFSYDSCLSWLWQGYRDGEGESVMCCCVPSVPIDSLDMGRLYLILEKCLNHLNFIVITPLN